jgi:Ni/Fe-hydrogenase subunit HybB-like protein
VAALVALVLLGIWRDPRQAMLSYLYAFFFFAGLSVGSLALLMAHAVTGGRWGYCIRPPLLAAARLLPLVGIAAIPILIEVRLLYDWSHSAALVHQPQAEQQDWYLNEIFFVLRTIFYFVVWIGWLFAFSRHLDDRLRARRVAAPGLVVFGLTSFGAATDWSMSLTPDWHSSIYGMLVACGWFLVACAMATATVTLTRDEKAVPEAGVRRDLGNMLLMLTLMWVYLAFMQYLTIWIADRPSETSWYIPRTLTSWRWLAWFQIAFECALPLALLLFSQAKKRQHWLRVIAVMLVVGNFANAFWLVIPSFRPDGFALRWSDLAAPVGLGAVWWCAWAGQLRVAWPVHARLPVVQDDAERAHG